MQWQTGDEENNKKHTKGLSKMESCIQKSKRNHTLEKLGDAPSKDCAFSFLEVDAPSKEYTCSETKSGTALSGNFFGRCAVRAVINF